MKNDQWFEPGDKVMRVSETLANGDDLLALGPSPDFGELLCVTHFWELDTGNLVAFIGYPPVMFDGDPWAEVARDFRKVEEIKLCVAAAEKAKQLTPQHA